MICIECPFAVLLLCIVELYNSSGLALADVHSWCDVCGAMIYVASRVYVYCITIDGNLGENIMLYVVR